MTYLHKVGDEEGEHDERKAEDVEQREGHKSLVGRQSIVWVVRVPVDQGKGWGTTGTCPVGVCFLV